MTTLRGGRAPLLLLCWATAGCEGEPAKADEPSAHEPGTAVGECGGQGEADCPTQAWMKATLQAHLRQNQFGRLEAALRELALKTPEGYDGWKELSEQAADDAKKLDGPAVRKACKKCHHEHRQRFRKELRRARIL